MTTATQSNTDLTEELRRQAIDKVKLHGLVRDYEWQCAWQSVPHAVKGKTILLTWDTPAGDLLLALTLKSGVLHIKKESLNG